jgi:hypothetical protein
MREKNGAFESAETSTGAMRLAAKDALRINNIPRNQER